MQRLRIRRTRLVPASSLITTCLRHLMDALRCLFAAKPVERPLVALRAKVPGAGCAGDAEVADHQAKGSAPGGFWGRAPNDEGFTGPVWPAAGDSYCQLLVAGAGAEGAAAVS